MLLVNFTSVSGSNVSSADIAYTAGSTITPGCTLLVDGYAI